MAESAKFINEKWILKSVLFYGCGAAGAEWTPDKKALKGEGVVLSLGNPADLTAGVLHYFGKNQNATNITAGSIAYALRTDTDLGGSSLDDAAINFGQFGEPEVALSFNALGAAKFS